MPVFGVDPLVLLAREVLRERTRLGAGACAWSVGTSERPRVRFTGRPPSGRGVRGRRGAAGRRWTCRCHPSGRTGTARRGRPFGVRIRPPGSRVVLDPRPFRVTQRSRPRAPGDRVRSPPAEHAATRADPVAQRSRAGTSPPTSGDNSVDVRPDGGGRFASFRWTTGDRTVGGRAPPRSVHGDAERPTDRPQHRSTCRHAARPGRTGGVHRIHRCEYYCCCSLSQVLPEGQRWGQRRRRPAPGSRGRR